jgi:hypothetical protein
MPADGRWGLIWSLKGYVFINFRVIHIILIGSVCWLKHIMKGNVHNHPGESDEE